MPKIDELMQSDPSLQGMSKAQAQKAIYEQYYPDIPFKDYLSKVGLMAAPIIGAGQQVMKKGREAIAASPLGSAWEALKGSPVGQAVGTIQDQEKASRERLITSVMGMAPFNQLNPAAARDLVETAMGSAEGSFGMPMGLVTPQYAARVIGEAGQIPSKIVEYDAIARQAGARETGAEFYAAKEQVPGYPYAAKPADVCGKSESCIKGVEHLKKELGKDYTPDMGRALERRMKEEGLPTPCPGCYDVSKRQKAVDQYGREIPAVKYGTTPFSGKISKGMESYINENKLPNGKNGIAIRSQINSDFEAPQISGQMAHIYEMGKRGASAATYSKDLRTGQIFGQTGMYINYGVSHSMEGYMPMKDAITGRNLSKNGSVVAIEGTEEGMWKAFDDPNTDHIIGSHLSGSKKSHVAEMGGVPEEEFVDFTKQQNPMSWQGGSFKATKPIPEANHWGNMHRYLQESAGKNTMPPFARYLLKREFQPVMEDLIKAARTSPAGVKKLNNYLMKHPEQWNRNYMKVVGAEYGKFGGVKNGYDAVDPSKIDLTMADNIMQQYKMHGELKETEGGLNIAKKMLEERKFMQEGLKGGEYRDINTLAKEGLVPDLPVSTEIK